MPRFSPIQNAFNSGEWSRRMFGRTDLANYRKAARSIENFQIIPQGGLLRRSGERFVRSIDDPTKRPYLMPFTFSDEQAYVLIWEENKVFFVRNEGVLLEATLSAIGSTTSVSDISDEFTVIGHGYQDGAGDVSITSTGTLPAGLGAGTKYYIRKAQSTPIPVASVNTTTNELDIVAHGYSDRMGPFRLTTSIRVPAGLEAERDYFIVFITADRFGLSLSPGGGKQAITDQGLGFHTLTPTDAYLRDKFRLSTTPTGSAVALSSPGTGLHTLTPSNPEPIFVTHTYSESEIRQLGYAQSADVLFLSHQDHPPRKLSRFSQQGFAIEDVNFQDGPYLSENATDQTMRPSATSGNEIDITSSDAIFVGTDVGRLIRIKGPAHWGYAKITAVNPVTFLDADIAAQNFVDANVNTVTDVITATAHNMDTGELIRLSNTGGALPTSLAVLTDYYMRALTANTLTLHTTRADALANTNIIDITTAAGGGTHRIVSSVIDIATHGYVGDEGPIVLTNDGGAVPDGLVAGDSYFIGFVDPNSLTLSETRGGTPAGIDDNQGGGTHILHGGAVPLVACRASVKANFQNNSAQKTWRLGSWTSDPNRGFPRGVAFDEQRLWWIANPGDPQTIFASKSADFESMSPTGFLSSDITKLDDAVLADNAIVYSIGDSQVNVVNWITSARDLLLGTTKKAWTIAASLVEEGIGPANIRGRPTHAYGSRPFVQPVVVEDRVVYPSASGHKIYSIGYSFESDAQKAEDLTLLAEHVAKPGGIDAIAFAEEPHSTVWCVRNDGELLAVTIVRDQEIMGWCRHRLGGSYVDSYGLTIDSVDLADDIITTTTAHGLSTRDRVRFLGASLPTGIIEHRDYWVFAVDDDELQLYDDPWKAESQEGRVDLLATGTGTLGLAVRAVVESVAVIPAPAGDPSLVGRLNVDHDQIWVAVKRTINGATVRTVGFLEDLFEPEEDLTDAFFVDHGISYNSSLTTSLTVLALAGETVDVLADGVVYRDLVVGPTGTLTIDTASALWHIGYRYRSDFWSLRLPAPSPEGTAETNLGKIDALVLRLDSSLGGKYGPNPGDLDDIDLVPEDLPADTLPPLYSDDYETPFSGDWETYGSIYVRQDDPLPFTLLAIIPKGRVGGRGIKAA